MKLQAYKPKGSGQLIGKQQRGGVREKWLLFCFIDLTDELNFVAVDMRLKDVLEVGDVGQVRQCVGAFLSRPQCATRRFT